MLAVDSKQVLPSFNYKVSKNLNLEDDMFAEYKSNMMKIARPIIGWLYNNSLMQKDMNGIYFSIWPYTSKEKFYNYDVNCIILITTV